MIAPSFKIFSYSTGNIGTYIVKLRADRRWFVGRYVMGIFKLNFITAPWKRVKRNPRYQCRFWTTFRWKLILPLHCTSGSVAFYAASVGNYWFIFKSDRLCSPSGDKAIKSCTYSQLLILCYVFKRSVLWHYVAVLYRDGTIFTDFIYDLRHNWNVPMWKQFLLQFSV